MVDADDPEPAGGRSIRLERVSSSTFVSAVTTAADVFASRDPVPVRALRRPNGRRVV